MLTVTARQPAVIQQHCQGRTEALQHRQWVYPTKTQLLWLNLTFLVGLLLGFTEI